MLHDADLVAFVPSTDLQRSRDFYEGVLGLQVQQEDPIAVAFDAHGTTLRVTRVPEAPRLGFTVLGWTVGDIATTVRDLQIAGIACERFDGMTQDDLGIWTTPGDDKVAWFTDPDGNVLSLTELAG